METWRKAALKYKSKGLKLGEIVEIIEDEFGLENMYGRVSQHLYREKKKQKPKLEKRVSIQNQEPEHYEGKWDGTETLRFAVMGDTQIGSKYTQLTHLHNFYDICEKEGIKDVYHTGDLTDGLKMRVGHEYELYEVSADEMRDDVVKNYPKRDGITTHFITGNHDASIYKHVGYDIGQAIAMLRPDMEYLGRDCAVVNLTPKCTLELRHPWDGSAYSLSYRPQKMIESMDDDSKPTILAIGHYHKQGDFLFRGVHAMLTASFQSQTPFLRGKSIASIIGGYIVTIKVDKDGFIRGFQPEFIHYKTPIKDDYKNFK